MSLALQIFAEILEMFYGIGVCQISHLAPDELFEDDENGHCLL